MKTGYTIGKLQSEATEIQDYDRQSSVGNVCESLQERETDTARVRQFEKDHVHAVSDDQGDLLELYRYAAFGEPEICKTRYNTCMHSALGNDPMRNQHGDRGRAVSNCETILYNCRMKITDHLNVKPLSSNDPCCDKYPDSYQYNNTGAKSFCKCAGDDPWSNYVRGCLKQLYDQGADAHESHMACYNARSAQGHEMPWGTLTKSFVKSLDKNPFDRY